MKIIFFGTPDFALPSLKRIFNSSHKICAVVTSPDKERGRGRKISFTPVKEFALQNNITCLQPELLKDASLVDTLKGFEADVFVVVAFRILPAKVYKIAAKGSFNLHGSLLPKYRGAAPIQWSLINGEKKTGVTTFFLKDKVDTGNIIVQKELDIKENDNFGTLHDKMSELGAEIVLETLNLIDSDKVNVSQQDNQEATPAPKITKALTYINWNNPAHKINNLVRGLSPYPGAVFVYEDKLYKVYSTRIEQNVKLEAGRIFTSEGKIFAGCSDESIEILEIQPEGRKKMSSGDFLRGYKI